MSRRHKRTSAWRWFYRWGQQSASRPFGGGLRRVGVEYRSLPKWAQLAYTAGLCDQEGGR